MKAKRRPLSLVHWLGIGIIPILILVAWRLRDGGDAIFVSSAVPPSGETPSRPSGASPVVKEAQHQEQALAAGAATMVTATPGAPAEVLAFRAWAQEYFSTDPSQRAALLEQGKELAKAHTIALAKMIPEDPKRAIENAVPMVVRQDLPKEIVELLEERVNRKGELTLWATMPKEGEPNSQPAYHRTYKPEGGLPLMAYVYGGRLAERTLTSTLVNGIAASATQGGVPVVAVSDSRVRQLEVGERPDPAKARSTTCPVSGISTALEEPVAAVSEATPAFEDDTTVHFVCLGGHIGIYNTQLYNQETAAHWAQLTQRSATAAADDNIAYEGATGGSIAPISVPTNWTTGVRKVLFIRATFSDNYQDPISEAGAYELMKQVSDEMTAMSYGRTYFQATVTPLLVLSRTEAWLKKYQDEGNYAVGLLYDDARQLAKAAGYDTDNYDLDVVRWNGSVGTFGGAAAVGGKFFADKVGAKSVSLHEFGHNLGLMHSNAWKTNPPSTIGPGYSFEYGNYWDWMGAWGEGGHFVAPTKAQLNWLPREGQALAQQSGTYRIHQTNQPLLDPAKRYVLRVRKDIERDYWFEFRPDHPTNLWMQNGLLATFDKWGGNAGGDISTGTNNGPVFLDMTPGSWRPTMQDTRQDGMLVIGRTFTDPETSMSVTPIGKNATTPPSIDVTVNLGPFPGNLAPTQTLSASATSVAAGVGVNLASEASDPNGDILAYAWDFGDGTFSTDNQWVQSKSWSAAGHYVVRCTVSDMKGKVHTAQVLITVGTPTTYTISGTVTGPGAVPLEGVQIANQVIDLPSNAYFTDNGFSNPQYASYRSGYTDSNGTYIITGVPAGSQTLYANLYPYTFTAGFANPLSVAANVTGANWTGADMPTLSIAAIDAAAAETGDTGTFRITRSGSTASDLQVQVLDMSGSASLTSDYTLTPALTTISNAEYLTIPAGSATLDVTLTPVNDTLVEGVESATMTLANVLFGYRVSGPNAASIQISDDESSLPVVSITSLETLSGEPANGASLLLTRAGSTAAPLTVNLSYSGTAEVGVDYSAPASVAFAAGQSTAPLPIWAINDADSEGTETVTVSVKTDPFYQIAGNAASLTFDFNDDDIDAVVITATDPTASEAGDPGLFTITRSGADLSQDLVVDYAVNGTAIHGKDYARLEGRATIPAGETSTWIRVMPYNDTIGEGDQTVVLTLRSEGRYLVGDPQTATVTITDDDLPSVYISSLTTGIAEPASGSTSTSSFRILRQSAGAAITVNYTVSGSASSGADYTALGGSVTFAASDTSKDISLTVLGDGIKESAETVTLTLAAGTGYQLAAFDTSATAVIIDADQPQIAVSATDPTSTPPTVVESATQVRFFISRNTNPATPLTVNYTMSGTATSGSDYTGATGSVTIPASAYGEYVTLVPTDDAVAEGTESVTLSVTASANYGMRTSTATILLDDNDAFAGGSPTVGFNAASSSVAETGGTLNIPVTLTGTPAAPVTVRYAITGGTADFGDAVLPAGTLTFAAAGTQNLALVVKTDSFPEGDETVKITLSAAYGAALGTALHTVTITDVAQPESFTRPPTNVVATTATLNGGAIPHGLATNAYFEWGSTSNYGNTTSPQAIGNGQSEVAVSQAISGLTPGQTYHFRMVATNSSGTSYGNDRLLSPISKPTAITLVANNRSRTAATLRGSVNPNGLVSTIWFEWGTTPAYGNVTASQSVGNGNTPVVASLPITGLTEATTYHYRVVASSSGGTSYGQDQSFVPVALAVAGNLYVNLRASNATAGNATWGSSGTLGNFTEVGTPALVADVVSTGIPGVQFDGTTTAYNGPNSVSDIHGASDRSVEVWFFNPAGEQPQETMVGLGHQGHLRSIFSVCPGSSNAVNFWTESVSWGTLPSYGAWHHMVIVYDGDISLTCYLDGSRVWTQTISAAVNTWALPIVLGSALNISNVNAWGSYGFSGYLNTVRIHGGQLTAAQVLSNYQYGPAMVDAPEVFTKAATNIFSDRFRANATVEPNGQATTAWIEYGTTTAYGNQSSATSIAAGSAPVSINPFIFASSGTTYHYRVVAQNASGTVYGDDVTVTTATIGIATAGTLYVDLNATQSTAGTASWTNPGSLGGTFAQLGTPTLVGNVASTSVPGVQFDGTTTAYSGPATVADIQGSSDRTIEAWFYNPAGEVGTESLVTLGRQGFGGNSLLSIAVGNYVAADMWGPTTAWPSVPSYGAWHHLAMVYDGVTSMKFYLDGSLSYTYTLSAALGTSSYGVVLGASRNNSSAVSWGGYGFSGYLNTVRIHGGQLDATQVARNYAAGPALPMGPAVFTSAATAISFTTATLNGTANPGGLATTAWFEYGTTTAYGSSTTAQSIGSGSTATAVTANLTGLTQGTLYHGRLVAQNSTGTSYGANVTFTTTARGTLLVSPAWNLASSGNFGGPFSPSSQVYTLSNPGTESINWTAGKTAAWVTLSATGGTLAAGANTTVTVSINSGANTLAANSYSDTVTFTNTTNAIGNTTRGVALTVIPFYTVTYNGNGNTGGTAPSSQTKTPYIDLVTASPGSLVRTGYVFAGWNTASNGSGTTYAAGSYYAANASVTLYAKWNASPSVNAGVDQAVTLSGTAWSPLESSPGLWLDASDATSITLNGGTVSQWNDKSGNNRHATQVTAANQPTNTASGLNGKTVLTFDGTDDFLSVDLDFLAGVSHSAFIVTKPTTYNNIYGAANGSAGASSLHVGFINTSSYRMNYWGNDYSTGKTSNFVAASTNILNYVWTSGTSKQIYANGKSEGTNPSAGVIAAMSGGGRISNIVGQGYFGGTIAEILMIPSVLSDPNRLKVEGYLANKWGLTANLAATHPYKSQAPTSYSAVVNLSGTASDPESDPITRLWTVVSGPGPVTFGNASAASTTATLSVAGTYVLRLTASDPTSSTSDDMIVTASNPAGVLNHFTISAISTTQTAGTPITGITITAKDSTNATLTSFNGVVTFGGTGGFSGTSAAFTNGVLSAVSVTPTAAGSNLTLTVQDALGRSGSTTIATINPSTVASFAISGISGTPSVASPIPGVTITAKDAYNNTATSFTGTVTYGGTGGFFGSSGAFTAGVLSSANVTPTASGANLTLTVSDGAGHTGSTVIASIRSAYQAWAIGPQAGNFTDSTPGVDFDGGGLRNAMEWVLGGDPTTRSDDLAIAPTVDNTSDPSYCIFTYRRKLVAYNDPKTAIAVQYGGDMQGWTSAVHDGTNVIVTVTNDGAGPGIDLVRVKLKRTLVTSGRMFVRLRALLSP